MRTIPYEDFGKFGEEWKEADLTEADHKEAERALMLVICIVRAKSILNEIKRCEARERSLDAISTPRCL